MSRSRGRQKMKIRKFINYLFFRDYKNNKISCKDLCVEMWRIKVGLYCCIFLICLYTVLLFLGVWTTFSAVCVGMFYLFVIVLQIHLAKVSIDRKRCNDKIEKFLGMD